MLASFVAPRLHLLFVHFPFDFFDKVRFSLLFSNLLIRVYSDQAFEKYTVEKDIAEYIKKEFDKNHGPTWHCIVGRNFGNSQ